MPAALARAALVMGVAAGLAGCAPDLSALAQDHNAFCADFTSVWFTMHVNRNFGCLPSASMIVSPK
jgi:hypothetical protein